MIMWIIIVICSAALFWVMRDKDEAKLNKEIKLAKKRAKLQAARGGKEWL